MEFEVSPGFTPHQHSAEKGNQPVRVVRSWAGPTPPVTLPLQPGIPVLWEEGSLSPPRLSVQEGLREGMRSLWWVWGHWGHWDSWDHHPHL